MLRWLPSPVRGFLAALVLGLNTLLICVFFFPFALVKLLIPVGAIRKAMDIALIGLADTWVRINHGWMSAVQKLDWHIEGTENLQRNGWYLVASNHQSWADILILQHLFQGKIPFLKFFLKRELIYVPVIGLAWWALDFPFMRRGGKSLAANAADLATARASCEKFRHIPTSVINFLEGTRFTAAKHKQQRSPYRHLLKPKSGGVSIALATMGDKFDAMLDVTIVYPEGTPNFWQVLCGQLGRVVVEVKKVGIPEDLIRDSIAAEPRVRSRIQDWLNERWAEKDERIAALLGKGVRGKE